MNANRNASSPGRQLRFKRSQVPAMNDGRAQAAEQGEQLGEKPDAMAGGLVQRNELDIVTLDALAEISDLR